jgi:hypothetical protein
MGQPVFRGARIYRNHRTHIKQKSADYLRLIAGRPEKIEITLVAA